MSEQPDPLTVRALVDALSQMDPEAVVLPDDHGRPYPMRSVIPARCDRIDGVYGPRYAVRGSGGIPAVVIK